MFLAKIELLNNDVQKLQNVPVVTKFSNIFRKEVPGLPSKREVKFKKATRS